MMLPAAPFPLAWPTSWPRTPDKARRRSTFGADHAGDVDLAAARAFVIAEFDRLGAARVVVTTDIPARRADAGRAPTGDPGAAAWFELGGEVRVLACDRWETIGENLRAIGLSVEAMRGLDRWGVGDVVERALAGFAALPAGAPSAPGPLARPVAHPDALVRSAAGRQPIPVVTAPVTPHWRTVLLAQDLGNDLAAIKASYRKLIKIVHPDAKGQQEHAVRLNAAMAAAERELAGAA